MRELYISCGPKWALNKWFWILSMKFEVWERWISITGGTGTAFPNCVQWHFNHWVTIESRSDLRSASNYRYVIPRSRLRFGERRFAVAGPKAWNNLPTRLHQTRSTVTFKRHLLSPFDLNEYTLASFYLITFNCFFYLCSLLVMFLCKQSHYDYDYDYFTIFKMADLRHLEFLLVQ